jgi:hypothetical protein
VARLVVVFKPVVVVGRAVVAGDGTKDVAFADAGDGAADEEAADGDKDTETGDGMEDDVASPTGGVGDGAGEVGTGGGGA